MAGTETIQQKRTSERRPWETLDALLGNHDSGYGGSFI